MAPQEPLRFIAFGELFGKKCTKRLYSSPERGPPNWFFKMLLYKRFRAKIWKMRCRARVHICYNGVPFRRVHKIFWQKLCAAGPRCWNACRQARVVRAPHELKWFTYFSAIHFFRQFESSLLSRAFFPDLLDSQFCDRSHAGWDPLGCAQIEINSIWKI